MAIRCRNNSSVVKEEVVSAVADAVTQGGKLPHKVDLSAPDRMVIVEIIQVCRYMQWYKVNCSVSQCSLCDQCTSSVLFVCACELELEC